jgi:hypothetical protein
LKIANLKEVLSFFFKILQKLTRLIKAIMKEWYISLEGKSKGPYTALELKRHPAVTPDTLVWKPGFEDWVPIRNVVELKEVFKDDPESVPLDELFSPPKKLPAKVDQDVLVLGSDPFQFFMWLLIISLILIYIFFQFHRNRM